MRKIYYHPREENQINQLKNGEHDNKVTNIKVKEIRKLEVTCEELRKASLSMKSELIKRGNIKGRIVEEHILEYMKKKTISIINLSRWIFMYRCPWIHH